MIFLQKIRMLGLICKGAFGEQKKEGMVSGSNVPCHEQGEQKDYAFQRFVRLKE